MAYFFDGLDSTRVAKGSICSLCSHITSVACQRDPIYANDPRCFVCMNSNLHVCCRVATLCWPCPQFHFVRISCSAHFVVLLVSFFVFLCFLVSLIICVLFVDICVRTIVDLAVLIDLCSLSFVHFPWFTCFCLRRHCYLDFFASLSSPEFSTQLQSFIFVSMCVVYIALLSYLSELDDVSLSLLAYLYLEDLVRLAWIHLLRAFLCSISVLCV